MFLGHAVFRNPPPNVILNNQHTQLFQLLSQIANVEADQTVAKVNIGSVIEYIQRA